MAHGRGVFKFLRIKGTRHYLWRAVEQDDNGLDILVQSWRNKKAAKKCFRKLLKGLTYVPRVVIPDKWQSEGAAKRKMLPGGAAPESLSQ
jgi:putative transposase